MAMLIEFALKNNVYCSLIILLSVPVLFWLVLAGWADGWKRIRDSLIEELEGKLVESWKEELKEN